MVDGHPHSYGGESIQNDDKHKNHYCNGVLPCKLQYQGLMSYGSCKPNCWDLKMPDSWWPPPPSSSPLNHSYHQVELLCLGVYWKLPNQKPPLSCDAHCTGTDFRSDQTRSVRARLYRHSRVIVHCNALVPWIKIIIVITIIIVNHCQVGRCQRLRSRRVVASGTGAMPELCWKSATASQSVARLRPLEEACTTGSTEALVKLKCIKTQQSLATVHRRSFPFWPLIPNTKACIQFYREQSQIKSLLFLGLEANQGCL